MLWGIAASVLQAQEPTGVEVRISLLPDASATSATHAEATVPAVVWLKPANGAKLPFATSGSYTLVQKHRMFTPHLIVVPVGSTVHFPNADPFFHDVFSLFDGKRFDLGLYEAGSTKEVRFTREGLSYIFCNIHPEMSAVVIALDTPLFAVADDRGEFHLHHVPPGDYDLHVWLEGESQPELDKLTQRVHAGPGVTDLGLLPFSRIPRHVVGHENKFGQPYAPEVPAPY